jgi:hypothetical protein
MRFEFLKAVKNYAFVFFALTLCGLVCSSDSNVHYHLKGHVFKLLTIDTPVCGGAIWKQKQPHTSSVSV